MNRQDIKEKIVIITEEIVGVSLELNESLKESGVDSLSLVTLIVMIEETFGVHFSDDDLQPDHLNTLYDLILLVEKYI